VDTACFGIASEGQEVIATGVLDVHQLGSSHTCVQGLGKGDESRSRMLPNLSHFVRKQLKPDRFNSHLYLFIV
jgi:hypothetical protein